jgi:hypothetical protein
VLRHKAAATPTISAQTPSTLPSAKRSSTSNPGDDLIAQAVAEFQQAITVADGVRAE